MAISSDEQSPEQPLQTPWTFWYDSSSANEPYGEALQRLGTVQTVQGFWRYYCNLTRPGQLEAGQNYQMFRGVLQPAIESLPDGGCWAARLKRGGSNEESAVNRLWEKLLLSLVGETIGEPCVVGAIVCVRAREVVFSVWCNEASDAKARASVEQQLRESVFEDADADASVSLLWKDVAAWAARKQPKRAPSTSACSSPASADLPQIVETRLAAAEARAAAAEARAAAVEAELLELRRLALGAQDAQNPNGGGSQASSVSPSAAAREEAAVDVA